MSDSLKQLKQMVPPPRAPFEAGVPADFSRVEATLGLSLPDDYKQLVLTYGSGRWQDFWSVLNPFTENRFLCACRLHRGHYASDTRWREFEVS